ncbi:AAA family ATPase [Rathayibacter sp. ZW T2_19]|uniref:AAA family ATPase n=1 Tax=Rathayibacter rubneri TaxID=2950106 RepID=A0A9X2DZ87_9MICO|nr:AAA family ATPase [Rathayibacter rubneri]MCM6763449.1 AAA family ATPase [Rathayibacter rubneri]
MLEESDRELMRVVSRYLRRVEALAATEQTAERTPLGDAVSEHLGADATTLAVTTEEILPHRLVDADLALDALGGAEASVLGVGGGEQRFHSSIGEMLGNPHTRFAPGPVTYATRATGPLTDRRVIAFGVRLLRFEGVPFAVLQRDAMPQTGRETASLEILSADEGAVPAFIRRLHALMVEHSVLRGQVLSFAGSEFGRHAGATFLPRPDVAAGDVVLEDGVLESVVDHVVGIGEHRDELLAAGQHLKRGLLLYGPPGTGKTLTVRHLLARTPGTTAVVLTGSSIRFIGAAAEIARTFPPALVVLEDIDLVAMERAHSPQPLLFEVLDALDGLDGDADVAFVMTTNRVQVLERALAARPGRVDLGVEIPLPGPGARRRLFRRYAASLPFSETALDAAAERAEGTTGSFAKELMRRSVLAAALRGAAPGDDDLAAALDTLLSSAESLTRLLLGSPGERGTGAGEDDGSGEGDGSGEDDGYGEGDGSDQDPGYVAVAVDTGMHAPTPGMSSTYSVSRDPDPGV